MSKLSPAFQVFDEVIVQDMGQDLPSHGEQENVVVVIMSISVSFALKEVDNGSILFCGGYHEHFSSLCT